MANFLKGIVIGIGGIAPGLSGSVLLVIFGLYQKTITAISTIFKDFKNNLKFLIPLFLGCGIGVILFSKVVDFLLLNYEMYTRFLFLGLITGTVPLFYKEVKKEGFKNKYYFIILISALIGISIFIFNGNMFPAITNPNLAQSILLGVAVAGSAIIPGVDSAAILSSLGLYELWVSSVANLNLSVLIPAAIGLGIGALVISIIINKLIEKYYTITFSVIFGLFLSVIPSVLNESCIVGLNLATLISFIMVVIGFAISLFFSNLKENIDKIKKILGKNKKEIEKENI